MVKDTTMQVKNSLVGQWALGDQEAGVGGDANSTFVAIRGGYGGLIFLSLLHEKIARSAIIFHLNEITGPLAKRQTHI